MFTSRLRFLCAGALLACTFITLSHAELPFCPSCNVVSPNLVDLEARDLAEDLKALLQQNGESYPEMPGIQGSEGGYFTPKVPSLLKIRYFKKHPIILPGGLLPSGLAGPMPRWYSSLDRTLLELDPSFPINWRSEVSRSMEWMDFSQLPSWANPYGVRNFRPIGTRFQSEQSL